MTWVKTRKKVAGGIRKALHVIAPVAKVAKEATQVLATIQKPTPIGVINATGSALATLAELVEAPDESPTYTMPTYVPVATMVQALQRGGFKPVLSRRRSETNNSAVAAPGGAGGSYDFTYPDEPDQILRVANTGNLWWWTENEKVSRLEPVRKALDAILPPVMKLTPPERENERTEMRPESLSLLQPPSAAPILRRTLSLLGQGRAILLEGRPGVGKTTAAQAIARDSGLGRVLLVDNSWLSRGRLLKPMWDMLSPGVIIIDDIDKVSVGLQAFEQLRAACRLLILTANNGTFDSVIDAALARPARIDEVFTVTAKAPFQRPPFDRLPESVWERVSQWPQAYLNELELRLTHTPNDLRLKDLVERLNKRTRSATGLMGDEPPEHPDDWWIKLDPPETE